MPKETPDFAQFIGKRDNDLYKIAVEELQPSLEALDVVIDLGGDEGAKAVAHKTNAISKMISFVEKSWPPESESAAEDHIISIINAFRESLDEALDDPALIETIFNNLDAKMDALAKT